MSEGVMGVEPLVTVLFSQSRKAVVSVLGSVHKV